MVLYSISCLEEKRMPNFLMNIIDNNKCSKYSSAALNKRLSSNNGELVLYKNCKST